ncbi:disks large-associated protein 5 isoform X2 [Saccopteryx bilineata]|uniref:disks large-associated protein 5 isoform X2 n=1 Tax=Saccopteryx bilineata TaxID=59482 RepID=UPI003390115A
MSSSHFASRHRKDFSTDMIRTKIAHRKSLSQKEHRHKEYERNRQFGLKDVNIPTTEGRLPELDGTAQMFVPEKASVKPKSVKTHLCDQRKQMLQKYKEEKQLQKLKEQREKATRVFKVGLYRHEMPSFLLSHQNTMKAEPIKAVPSFVRMTRSKAKDQMKPTKIDNGNDIRAYQPGQRQASEKKMLDKEKKAEQPEMTNSVRMTRAATRAAKQIERAVLSTTTKKPGTRATPDNEAEKKATNQGRPAKNAETKPDKVISFQVDKENNLDLQTSATNGGVLPKIENLPKTNSAKTKGKNSFAPKDFTFQPLEGLKIYQVTPMTPRSANAFLTPSYTWTSMKREVDKTQDSTKETLAQKRTISSAKTVHQDSNKLQYPPDSLTVWNKENVLNKNETTKNSSGLPIKEVPSPEISEGQLAQPQHNVPYFRNILQSETEKLTSHCLNWDKKLELDIPDDAKDLIRIAVGQTRLLMKERFKQFEGLVDDCEYKRGTKETTCTDLDGFWDMVSFQIEDVNQKFSNLTKLEESGWQNNNNTSQNVFRKKVASGIPSKPKQGDGGRMAARSRLAAIKKAARERMEQEEHAAATASAVPKEVDKIVFDAGFFRVESPVKSFPGLSVSSEHLSQRLRTPKSVSKAVSDGRADLGPPRQPATPRGPAPHSTGRECADGKTLLSNIPGNRSSIIEDAQCPRLQDLIEVNHDMSKINFEMDCLPSERMNLLLPAGEVAYDINTNREEETSDVVEGMELNSSITTQDVLMSSPEKNIPSQNNTSQEEEPNVLQSVFDNKSLTSECPLLDSPGLSCSQLITSVQRGERAKHISFGGNLIAFSPLRPLGGEQPEEV